MKSLLLALGFCIIWRTEVSLATQFEVSTNLYVGNQSWIKQAKLEGDESQQLDEYQLAFDGRSSESHIKLDDFKFPSIKIKIPRIEIPRIKAPKIPKMKAPKVKVPQKTVKNVSKVSKKVGKNLAKQTVKELAKEEKCNICKGGVKRLVTRLGRDRNRIHTAINSLCSGFGSIIHLCNDEFRKNKEEIIKMVIDRTSEDRICNKIKFC